MSRHIADIDLAERALAGDSSASEEIKEIQDGLMAYFLSRKVKQQDAEDVISRIWEKCFPSDPERISILTRYTGATGLKPWFITIGLNILIDFHRKQSRLVYLAEPEVSPGRVEETPIHKTTPGAETELVTSMIRDAFKEALEAIPLEERLILTLIFFEGIQRQEVARCWGCCNARITRITQKAAVQIREETLNLIRKREPWLEVEWSDVLKIAASVRKLTF